MATSPSATARSARYPSSESSPRPGPRRDPDDPDFAAALDQEAPHTSTGSSPWTITSAYSAFPRAVNSTGTFAKGSAPRVRNSANRSASARISLAAVAGHGKKYRPQSGKSYRAYLKIVRTCRDSEKRRYRMHVNRHRSAPTRRGILLPRHSRGPGSA